MKDTTDDLFDGNISRRKFIERATAAGLTLAVLGDANENEVAAQIIKRTPAAKPVTPDWTRLQTKVQGRVVPLGGVDYESSRRAMVWNAVKPERFPDAIVRISSEADVREAIRFARKNKLKVAIRGGGHHWHNSALRQGGLLLDLSGLNRLQVDAKHRTAVVQPGVTGATLMANLAPHGLAFPICHSPEVRMSGYLLNGGFGHNCGVWGPACASVEAIEVVDARGESIRADRNHNAEMFWAARGAGPGFFGVVTRFHLKVFPLPRAILRSELNYRIEDLDKVAAWLPQLARSVPANVGWFVNCGGSGARAASAGRLSIMARAFADSASNAREALGAFEAEPTGLKSLSKSLYQEAPFESVFGSSDAPDPEPEGPRFWCESVWSNASPQELLSSLRDRILAAPAVNPRVGALLWFSHREDWPPQPDMALSMSASTYVPVNALSNDAAHDAGKRAWLSNTIASLEPLTVGRYVGEADLTSAPDRAKQCFSPSAWDKLIRLKRKYDPDDMFFSYLQHA